MKLIAVNSFAMLPPFEHGAAFNENSFRRRQSSAARLFHDSWSALFGALRQQPPE